MIKTEESHEIFHEKYKSLNQITKPIKDAKTQNLYNNNHITKIQMYGQYSSINLNKKIIITYKKRNDEFEQGVLTYEENGYSVFRYRDKYL